MSDLKKALATIRAAAGDYRGLADQCIHAAKAKATYLAVAADFDLAEKAVEDAIATVAAFVKRDTEITAKLGSETARLDWLAEHSYREGGKGDYAPVYVIAHSSVWPVVDHEMTSAERQVALRAAVDTARQPKSES